MHTLTGCSDLGSRQQRTCRWGLHPCRTAWPCSPYGESAWTLSLCPSAEQRETLSGLCRGGGGEAVDSASEEKMQRKHKESGMLNQMKTRLAIPPSPNSPLVKPHLNLLDLDFHLGLHHISHKQKMLTLTMMRIGTVIYWVLSGPITNPSTKFHAIQPRSWKQPWW